MTSEYRTPSLVAIGVVTLSYTSVLYHVTDVVGGSLGFVLLVCGTVGLATAVGRHLRPATALTVAVVLLAGGLVAYVLSVPESQRALLTVDRILSDTVALLTGLSVLRLTQAGVWASAIAPGPVFLSWYLAVRERYVWSAAVGGAALSLFVLTGDAGTLTTLVGVVGVTGAVGLGTLDEQGGTPAQLDALTVVVATMVVLATTLSVVPGAAAGPILTDGGGTTVEASLVEAEDRIAVLGSIRLSPKVRFTVQSDRGEYWQTAAYDRYTGTGWVRSGKTEPYPGRLASPPGSAETVEQTVTAETPLGTLPAAWKPVEVEGPVLDRVRATPQGGIRPAGSVETGERYTVTSRVPEYTTEDLQRAGTDYPDGVVSGYTQLPDSTPDRVRERTAEVTAGAETPYAKAVAIEEFLESSKEYSLNVAKPDGNVADAFLFEMDAGYCVYYATTMVTMLRAEGVPARFVVGYTPGQQVDGGEYVVRGLDSHAWVQVYFPDVGWVRFDPTPSGPRESAEQARLTDARQNQEAGVDTTESEPTTTPMPATGTPVSDVAGNAGAGGVESPTGALESGDTGESGGLPTLPSTETLAIWGVAVAGIVAGARRLGVVERLYRALWVRYQPTSGDPAADAERAFARLEHLYGRLYRERRDGETPRRYVEALLAEGADERALEVLAVYERARYGAGVHREEADRAVEAVDALARGERVPAPDTI